MTIIVSNLNRFLKKFTGRFLGKFVVKWILKLPPHLAYVATLPCEKLTSAKQAINDKLQGSVATYLRCGWVVNKQIKKSLLLSLLQARAWLSHALCVPGQHTAERRRKCTRQSRSACISRWLVEKCRGVAQPSVTFLGQGPSPLI